MERKCARLRYLEKVNKSTINFAFYSVCTIFGHCPKVGCISAMETKKLCYLFRIALGFHYLCTRISIN